MAANPFSSSPYADAGSEFADTPPVKRPVSRGMAPTTDDITKRAQELGVDPKLALSFFSQESSSNWGSSDSPKGAKGGMQVMPATYRSMMGTTAGQDNPWNNMEAGLRYIQYGQRVLGTRDPALLAAGYHAGYDRKSLKAGIIPATNDGSISTSDYARSVANRVRAGSKVSFDQAQPSKQSAADEFSDAPPVHGQDEFSDTPPSGLPGSQQSLQPSSAVDPFTQAEIDNQPYIPRLIGETKAGFGDMGQALAASRWALGGGDTQNLAEDMAGALQAQSSKPQTTDQKEINAAYDKVTNAKGVVDTTVAGAQALWSSLTHPKETSIEIARNAANSLPTIVGGAAGSGAGAAAGGALGAAAGGVGAVPGAIGGAIWGGRAGMAAGTAATELGSEIQDMVQKKLAAGNLPPTAQNVLAILNDKEFQAQALKQGTIKGLTVAAVDQLFMGLGGKVATAPARAIAAKELADQGVNMATRAARRAALESPAGVAAIQAAKPSLAARAGGYAAALGVDAAGESLGEGLSQFTSRGSVDYGDALREGVVSIGQSVAETVAGSTIEHAKMAAKVATANAGLTPVAAAPSTASGPLARAAENAAAEPERVTVTAPDGQVSGTVVAQGKNAAQIVGDDGQVYNFRTGPGGVKIEPEAPNTPLSNALAVAADEHAAKVEAPAPAPAPSVPEQAAAAQPAAEPPKAEIAAGADQAEPVQTHPKAPDLSEMSDKELRERLKYISSQAKTNGGWEKMLVQQRRLVEREINSRAPAIEADVSPLPPKEETATAQELVPIANKPAPKPPTLALEAPKIALPAELASAKPRFTAGKKAFELKFASDFDKAAYIAFASGNQRASLLPQIVQATGMDAEQVREHGSKVEQAITAMAKDASPGTLKVPDVTVQPVAQVSQPAPSVAAMDEGAGATRPTQAVTTKPKGTSKEDLEHLFGIDIKRQKALELIAKGTAYFHDGVKAKDFIAKNGLADTHEVVKGKGGRWDIVAKATPAESQTKAPKPTVQPQQDEPSEVTHNGTRIYKANVKIGGEVVSRWVVESPDNKARRESGDRNRGGDTLHETLDQAKKAADFEAKQEAANKRTAEREAKDRAAAEAEAKAKKSDDYSGFMDGLPENRKELIRKALAKLINFRDGGVMSIRSRIDALMRQGTLEISTGDVPKIQPMSRSAFNRASNAEQAAHERKMKEAGSKTEYMVNGSLLGKTAYDYASHLLNQAKDKNGSNDNTSGQPAITETVVSGQEAKSAEAAAVQPAEPANEEVARPSKRVTMEDLPGATRTERDMLASGNYTIEQLVTARTKNQPTRRVYNQDGSYYNEVQRQVAPGARINGDAERAAADRLEKLYGQMGNITDRNSREGNAKAQVLSMVEELRKPSTPVSVAAVLEKASSDLMRKFSAFSDVIDDVASQLVGSPVQAPAPNPQVSTALIKFRNPATGESWSGRGLKPRWLIDAMANGAKMEDFAVNRADEVSKKAPELSTSEQRVQETAKTEQVAEVEQKPTVSANQIFTEDGAAKMRALLNRKLSQLNSGIDPEILQAGIYLAGYHIERGARTFAAYSKAMIDDLGEVAKPYLKSWYMGVKYDPRAATFDGMSTAAEVDAADVDALAAPQETSTIQKAKGNDNGTQELDQSGAGKLEGQQPAPVPRSEPQRQAGNGAEGRSGSDVLGNERAGEVRPQPAGSVGNDAGEVPSDSTRGSAGRGGEQGGGAVQRSQRAAKQDSAKRESGNQPDLTPETGTRAQDRADGTFTITDADAIGEGGAKTKFRQNVDAIKLLSQLTAEKRQATRAEQAILAKYVGWGGIPQAFGRDNGEVSKGWEKEVAELRSVLTSDELAAAAASTRNAHYTSTEIVSAVWDAVKHFGFQGGRVLEPSVGVGNFFGLMPTALRSSSQLTGVELDRVTGGIAKQLYPQANIQAPVGFQDFSAPDNYFDLAIGNPPFGREGIYDASRRKISGFSIHNYFFAKSIDTVKPNGVLAMVVTNRLLDSAGDKARSYIADRAEFLGAIRLPNNAFAKNAGTDVTTDIIFLRKRKDGEVASSTAQAWMDVKQFTDANGVHVPLNEYFVKHPEMMLGTFGAYGSMYSPTDAALVAKPGQDTPAMMRAAMASLPKGFMDAPTAAPALETIEPMHDISHVKVGSVFEQGGKIFERGEDMLGKQQAKPIVFASEKAQERVTGMIAVRDALVEVRGLQLKDGVSDKALESARAKLNRTYDAFVSANGPINADANKRLMRDDPTWAQLAALEDSFDKGVSAAVAKSTGEKARPASANKSAIFTKRTQSPYHPPQSASSAKDALVSSLAERGRVDLDYMASLYGKTPEVIANELDGLIFEVVPGDYVTREEYLSGNVKKRLALTIELAKKMPRFSKNVETLRSVQPADIEAVDIDVKAGAHWIPADVMQAFIGRITEGQNAKAVYNPVNAAWTLSAERISAAASTEWATDRVGVMNVLEAAANQKQITVYDQNFRDGTRTLNEAATTAANEKVSKLKAEWKNWIWADDARRQRLSRIYNDTFNTDVQREFDGSHLSFPGKVGDDIIRLRPHQANAVWRMVQSGTTLLDHVVGAGKTFTMIAGIMEMRRMGMAKKPMLVVPNHLVGQWAEDFMKLYPGANILAATKKDFEKESRRKLFARISTGDWDAVIVAHSSFGKVEVDPHFQEEFIRQQIDDMDTSIQAMRSAEGKNSRNVKQIEKQKAMLEEKLKKLFDTGSKDDNLYFSELGVDAVLLDEAHEFKNLGFSTGMQRVAGLGNASGSNKAADAFMKVQSVLKRTGGRNVVFATGTPISNTMAEMYTMQRYLDYGTLKDQGIAHFDAWAKTFGEVVTDWELSPSGQYKMNSRFARFVNMPELMQRYQSFADVVNRDDINRMLASQGKKLPVPKVATGKPENVIVERSADQAGFIGMPTTDENGAENYPQGSLIWRSENLPKKVAKGSDNMLKIMSDARKAALDMRLIDPSYPDNPASKVNVAARNVKAIYDKSAKDKGTQLVFIDLSTPKGAVAKEAAALRDLVERAAQGDESAQEKLDAMSPDDLLALDSKFSVYDDLKAKLIASGIPEHEVAFIHDAGTELQKEDLFAKVRSGRVRVLLGSTAKMGAGMNVQDRLVALHHLDAPWRPSDLEQREGRIIRQGNKLYDANPEGFEVRILRYATKQTLDSRMWQTIEGKARFIEQVRKGVGTEREVEDVAGEAANSAEMKAASSGNPLILEEMSLRQSIRKLDNQQAEHNREQYRIKDRMRMAEDAARRYESLAVAVTNDAKLAPVGFEVKTKDGEILDKHKEAGEAIMSAVDAMLKAGEESRDVGTYGGFNLTADNTSAGMEQGKAVLTIQGSTAYQIEANAGSNPTGLALRLQNTVKGLAQEAQLAKESAERNRGDIPKLKAQIKPWGMESDLAKAKARHTEVIDQLKPKKKEAAQASSDPALEAIFAGLEQEGGPAKKQAEAALSAHQNAETIRAVDKHFWDILSDLEEQNKVSIKC